MPAPNPGKADRCLFGLLALVAASFGHLPAAHANHSVPPFGIHCDSVGPAGIAYVPGVNCRLLEVDQYTRRYVVWVPAWLPANPTAVFMLHGASGTGEQFLVHSGWREKATQEGFVVVFPTAVEHFVLDKQRFSTRWNNYNLPRDIDPNRRPSGYPATSPWPADDVEFIRRIISEDLNDGSDGLVVDPKRMYVAGFSSGGGMCARLGVELSELIAAVACHAGGIGEVHETLVGHRNLSMLYSIGSKDRNALDQINALRAGLGLPPVVELPLDPAALKRVPILSSHIDVTLESLDLAETPVSIVTDPLWTELTFQTPQAGNLDSNELIFGILDEVEHEYPNGGNNLHGFSSPDRAWLFFTRHVLP
jgi:poly(3-hydroxybutyrate) depolymerase